MPPSGRAAERRPHNPSGAREPSALLARYQRAERRWAATRGYTLTELMMVVAILGFMATVGPGVMVNAQRFFLQSLSRVAIQRDARAGLSIMNRFLRQAKATSIVIDTPDNGPVYSRITFEIADGRTMSFWQDGSTLYQKVENATSPLSKNLRFVTFTMPRTDNVSIMSVSMTMEKSTYEGGAKALELTIQKIRVMN